MLTETNRSRLGSLAAAAAGLLFIACATPGAWADVFNIYVVADGNGDVYQIPSNFAGAAVGSGQIFASGYTAALTPSPTTASAELYIAQIDGQIFVKNAASAPGGTGSAFANVAATTYDMDFADAGNLQAVGGTNSTVTVLNSGGSIIGTYAITGGTVIAGIDYAPGDGVYVAEGSHIQHMVGSGTSYIDATSAGLAAVTVGSSQFFQQIIKATDGNLYTSNFQSGGGVNIYRINPTTGAETQLFPANGQLTIGATTYSTIGPTGVEEGPDGRLYFADYHNNRIFSINLDGTDPELVATGVSGPNRDRLRPGGGNPRASFAEPAGGRRPAGPTPPAGVRRA